MTHGLWKSCNMNEKLPKRRNGNASTQIDTRGQAAHRFDTTTGHHTASPLHEATVHGDTSQMLTPYR